MPERDRPNILLIMTDQQRGDCLSIEGHPCLLTPNMDGIAAEGVRFRRCYSTCPSCIAARRSLLSGQFPGTHGMVGYQDGVEWDAPPTLPGVLRDAGYQTQLVGRSMHQYPTRKRYGFDHMVIHGWDGDYDPWLAEQAPHSGGWFGGGVMHNDWTARPWHLPEHLHMTNWTVREALKFARARDPSCPFFLAVSFVAPHPPLQPPAFYMERYLRVELPEPTIGDWAEPPPDGGLGGDVAAGAVNLTGEKLRCARAGYYGLINHVDDQLRRVLNNITGISAATGRDTVIIFTSDHGEMLGDHYRWRKILPYEPSSRIPLLMRAPERFGLQRRSVVDEPVCLEDIMPTVLDLAGVPVPETVEGRSLLPLMRGEKTAWRSHLHVEHAPIHHTVTDGKRKYIWFAADGSEQFFDLTTDPNECRNRIADPGLADCIRRWRHVLIEYLKGRPEGFTDGERLLHGRPYKAALEHAGRYDPEWKAQRRRLSL